MRAFCVVVMLLAPSASDAQRVLHRIRFGETLEGISRHYYGVAAHAMIIAAANNMELGSELKAGEHVRVPTAWDLVVSRATTLERLAQEHLGDARRGQVLSLLNKLRKRKRLKPGQKLIIPFTISQQLSSDEGFAELAKKYYGDARLSGLIAAYNFITEPKPPTSGEILIPIGNVRISPQRMEELVRERILGLSGPFDKESRAALQEANAQLRGGDYWSVPFRLIQLMSLEIPSDSYLADAYKLLAVTYVAMDNSELAVRSFQEALLHQPTMALDPVTTSPKVIRAFVDAKTRLREGGP